jgi:hypothetical protein
MINIRKIEILESDKNSKGDLFGRLMGDFFSCYRVWRTKIQYT